MSRTLRQHRFVHLLFIDSATRVHQYIRSWYDGSWSEQDVSFWTGYAP